MKNRTMIISAATLLEVARVIRHAEAHPWSLTMGQWIAGEHPEFVCIVPVGYRCTYSVEDQPSLGLCHHLSVSVMDGPAPGESAVDVLLDLFGFTGGLKGAVHAWVEDIGPDQIAINVLARFEAVGQKAFAE